MVDDGLDDLFGAVDVALAQHVLPEGRRPVSSALHRRTRCSRPPTAMHITVYGRGAHGSMPQAAVEPGGTRGDDRDPAANHRLSRGRGHRYRLS